MATRLACTPFEKDHRVALVKIASSLYCVFIERFEHFSKAALLQDTLCILPQSQTPGLIHFTTQNAFYLFFFLVRSNHYFQSTCCSYSSRIFSSVESKICCPLSIYTLQTWPSLD